MDARAKPPAYRRRHRRDLAYRHAARYYLEVARNPGVTREFVDERLLLDTPDLIAEAVVPGKAVLFVGLHFGSVELASLFLAFQVGETVIPMETIDSRPAEVGREMRINLYRIQGPPPDRKWINWQPVNRDAFHTPEAFGRPRLED